MNEETCENKDVSIDSESYEDISNDNEFQRGLLLDDPNTSDSICNSEKTIITKLVYTPINITKRDKPQPRKMDVFELLKFATSVIKPFNGQVAGLLPPFIKNIELVNSIAPANLESQ